MPKSDDNQQAFTSNFIRISRKIFNHEFWEEDRPFSRFEAWLDLLQSAKYEEGQDSKIIKGRNIIYQRGEFPASVRFLQNRWSWGSITKVETFLKQLQNKDMISLKKGQSQMVISICKYDSYNPLKNQERTDKGQQVGQTKDKVKNIEYKNINISYVEFWELYDKKVGDRNKIEKKWMELKDEDRTKIMQYIPKYKLATPNKKYRKDPSTFLNNKSWLDEIILDDEKKFNKNQPQEAKAEMFS